MTEAKTKHGRKFLTWLETIGDGRRDLPDAERRIFGELPRPSRESTGSKGILTLIRTSVSSKTSCREAAPELERLVRA
ncbi:hypothetical protein [Antarcticirhabdus aurantiaca]|uniref:Uncharacterized protein n=1 Tax=Antarcticirhabdus aurantiaca TaxID=2606717 RepID=A0ACD4NRG0_9HYPH|nr:hypothetical protein [Antarcticirhabdus aurantiaca]WAJ29505.1 hypothetical protein OXU80_04525 [Jeongeuplla avenae]